MWLNLTGDLRGPSNSLFNGCCEGPQRMTKRGTGLLFRELPLRLLSMLSLCSHYLRLFGMHALHMLADLESYWN